VHTHLLVSNHLRSRSYRHVQVPVYSQLRMWCLSPKRTVVVRQTMGLL